MTDAIGRAARAEKAERARARQDPCPMEHARARWWWLPQARPSGEWIDTQTTYRRHLTEQLLLGGVRWFLAHEAVASTLLEHPELGADRAESTAEPSPIESVVPLNADLAIVTVRKFDGTTTEYTASRHSAAEKVRAWEAQPL